MKTRPVPQHVEDAGDPRLADYRQLKERHLQADEGKFIAESEMVVRKLLESPLAVSSVLLTAPRWKALADEAPWRPDVPVYLVPQAIMDGVAGFHVHRGCLAIGHRPVKPEIPEGARLVVALEDLVDVDNVGAMVRNACAFGADALLLSPRCADPYYRKAIRVAMGNTFSLPIVRSENWPADLERLRTTRGFHLVGAVLDERAVNLADFHPPPKPLLVLLGAEGPGLVPKTAALCDERVTIPMANADSLNVATAGAICLYSLVRDRGGA